MAARGGAPGLGVKKFALKPVGKPMGMDQSRAHDTFLKIAEAINHINNANSSHLSFEELYRHSYNLVLHKHGELLYNGVCETVAAHLHEERTKVCSQPDELLLAALRQTFERHVVNMRMIRDILMYMDRTFVSQARKLPVFEQGLLIFRETVAQHPEIRPRLQRLLLAAVRDHRNGGTMDASLIRSVLSMLVELGIGSTACYAEEFEGPMLAETARFYHDESRDVLGKHTAYEYCRYAERRLAEERQRADLIMHPSSGGKLMSLLEAKLVAEHAIALVEMEGSGLLYQLEHERYEDVQRLFRLFAAVKTSVTWRPPSELVMSDRDRERSAAPVVVLKDVMKAQIMRKGLALLFDAEAQREPPKLIQALLDLRDKYGRVVEAAFHNDRMYQVGLKEAFENILNRQEEGRPSSLGPNVVPEYLALYVDEAMKHDFKALPEAEVDERLNKVVQLFRFLSSKDVFEEFYKQTTAKRLLGGRVASDDVEKLMIGKLKAECGANYTHKLEGMFSDLSKSALFMANFRRERRDRLVALSGGCDIDVTVLTAPNWSSTVKPVPMAVLPPSIAAAAAEFSKYYLDKHNGRKLQWNCGKGTAEVRARIGVGAAARTYELTVSTYQMIMLLAFNGPEAGAGAAGSSSASPSGGAVAIPYRDFLRFDIPEDELKRHLLSLCNPKVRLLNKSTAKKDVDEEDVFTVNDAFASKLLRIKVPLISMKSAQQAAAAAAAASGKTGGAGAAGGRAGAGGDDAGDVMANVEEGRKALLESVIVRVMKARKHMEHNALVAEVIRMVSARFTPDMASIKKRIEHLIERDYMERSAENHNMYAYLA